MLVANRRNVQPLLVHLMWDILARNGGQMGYDVFLKMLSLQCQISEELMNQELRKAIREGLVLACRSSVKKEEGGKGPITLRIPEPSSLKKEGHDWYCFNCHKGGEVCQCNWCPRVYHYDCLPGNRKPKRNVLLCPCCHNMATKPSMMEPNMAMESLNKALLVMINHYENKLFDEHKKANGETYACASNRPSSDAWRFMFLVYMPMDWVTMAIKARNGKYVSLEELQVDCLTMLHCIAIYFGEAVVRNQYVVLNGIRREIDEIKMCPVCYERSFQPYKAFWFCMPCPSPHDVVWTPHNACTYWPAKVMKKDGNKFYIRFFGDGKFQSIDLEAIQPVDDSKIAQVKMSRASDLEWSDVYHQFATHQDLVQSKTFDGVFVTVERAAPVTAVAPVDGKGSTCKRRIQSVRPQQVVTKKTRPSLVTRKENADPILPGGNVSASQETSQIKDQPTASTSSNKAPHLPELGNFYEPSDSNTPARSTEGALDFINFVLKHRRTPPCCFCLVDIGNLYCCKSLVFCSPGCQKTHRIRESKAHSCIPHDA